MERFKKIFTIVNLTLIFACSNLLLNHLVGYERAILFALGQIAALILISKDDLKS